MSAVFFPSVRGTFGDWVYYVSVIPIQEVARRVSYVKDVHESNTNALSELLQRSITPKREEEIATYLCQNSERFFNSLVLAIYDNHPVWFPADVSSSNSKSIENMQGEVGLLEFSGTEKIIPIDGQHRLAGIKSLLKSYNNNEVKPNEDYPFTADMVPVIFVAHRKDSTANRLRTRRLFTTLNKYAVKVNRYEIISLDEDDPMAITTRWLVEKDHRFMAGRIKFKGGANILVEDGCLTSIENLYDILTILFTQVFKKGNRKALTTGQRPSDKSLKQYRDDALSFFDGLEKNYPEISRYFALSKYEDYAHKQRKNGHVLFRPVGLKLIANLLSKFEKTSIEDRFCCIKTVPMNLNDPPYNGLLISEQGLMQDGNETKVRNLLLSALGMSLNKTEIRSAIAGLSILTGKPQNTICKDDIPNSIEQLKEI